MKRLLLFVAIACGGGKPCTIPPRHNFCQCGARECTACLPDALTELDGLGTVQVIRCAP